jgi:hypothetical protein
MSNFIAEKIKLNLIDFLFTYVDPNVNAYEVLESVFLANISK